MGKIQPTPEAKARTAAQDEFECLCEEYVDRALKAKNAPQNTVRSYRSDLQAFVAWTRREGLLPLSVSHRELRSYLGELMRVGYSSRTIARHLSALRGLYSWLAKEGKCDSAAASAVSSPKLSATLPKTMSDAEAQRLLAACPGDDPLSLRDRAFLELLYATGARISEVSGLDVADVDFGRMQVSLFGKRSKERLVPIYETAADWVRRYLDEARPVLLRASKEASSALFLSKRGTRMSAEALRKRFELHVREAGLDPTLTPHAMRHTFATELLDGGADLRSVQELLGHESLSTTQVYTHLSVERLKEASKMAHPRNGGLL